MGLYGIGSLIVFVLAIYAIVMVAQSSEQAINKIIWIVVILALPLIGVIAWYFMGPGKKPF